MKRLLLATVAVACFSVQAAAQLTVHDPMQTLKTALGWAQQAKDEFQKLEQLRQQYALVMRTYQAISHATDVGGVASALGGVTRRYLPEASDVVSGVAQGSRLLSSATSSRAADTLYIPQALQGSRTMERWLFEMDRRQNATANAKALAEDGLHDMQERMEQLAAAQATISAAPDGTAGIAVGNLIATSRANLEAHRASIESVRLALHAEDRAERQRGEQNQALGASEWGEATRWAVDALN